MRKLFLLVGAVGATALVGIACGSSASDGTGGPSVDVDGGGTKTDASGNADSGPDSGTPQPATFSVGGKVTGLLGTGLVLQNNGGDDIPVAKDGSFTFPKKLSAGASFAVTIKTQPSAPTQSCSVSGGTGTIANGDVSSVTVNCDTNKFTVGGTVSGLAGSGLVLQNNAGDDLIVNSNGEFSFGTTVSSGADYAVTVKTQPSDPTQTCTVANGSGKVGGAKVTSVTITCVTNEYKVGGTVAGLVGSGLTLQVNGGQSLPVAANGDFQFPTALASGSNYEVTVSAQPGSPQQTCTVSGGTGTVGSGDISSVLVNCSTDAYAVGGKVSGLDGKGLVLKINGGNDLPVNGNGSFAFSTPIANGQPYEITIASQPTDPWQTCSLANASGTVGTAAVEDIAVTCTTNTYKVKGSVAGLDGSGLVLQINGGGDIPVTKDGGFEFAAPVASGATFNVTVKDQPTGLSQTCTVSNGAGTIKDVDVDYVSVSCATNSYTVSATVSGLVGSGLVVQNNLGDQTPISTNGSFTFSKSILSGGAYDVGIFTQPTNPHQTCVVSAGSGTVTNGNVVSVAINCSTNTYTVGGNVSGLKGTGLVLQNNLGDDLTVNGDGSFSFGNPIASGLGYSVTVKTQPTVPSQTCVVNSGSGTIVGSAVSNISVTCTTNKYKVGGTVTGLTSGTLVLQNSGGDNLTLTGNGPFSFNTSIDSGATYNATVFTQPANLSCAVTSGSGTVGAADVTTVSVLCQANKRVFVTSTKYGGNLGGLDGADAKCQARANAANLGGTYRAWLSDNTGSPSTRFTKATVPYVRIDGVKVANNWTDLTDGSLLATISVTELNATAATTNFCGPNEIVVWTNTTSNGTQTDPNGSCGNWSGASASSYWGFGKRTDSGFTQWCSGSGFCTISDPNYWAPLYCFEQ